MNIRDIWQGQEHLIGASVSQERTARASVARALVGVIGVASGALIAQSMDADIPVVSREVYEAEAPEYMVLADTYRAGESGEIETERVVGHDYTRAFPFSIQRIVPLENIEDPAEIARAFVEVVDPMVESTEVPLMIEGRIFDPETSEITHDVTSNPDSPDNPDDTDVNVAAYSFSPSTQVDVDDMYDAVFEELDSIQPRWYSSTHGPTVFPVVRGDMTVPYTFEGFANAIDTAQELRENNVGSLQRLADNDPELAKMLNDPTNGIVNAAFDGPALVITASQDPSSVGKGTELINEIGPICEIAGQSENTVYTVMEKKNKLSWWMLMHLNVIGSPLLWAHVSRRRRRSIDGILAPSEQDIKEIRENTASPEQKINLFRYRKALRDKPLNDREILRRSRRSFAKNASAAMALSILPIGAVGLVQIAVDDSKIEAPERLSEQLPEPALVDRDECEPTDFAQTRIIGPDGTIPRDGVVTINSSYEILREDLPEAAVLAGK